MKEGFDCDIIVITWNGLEYTKKCLESVQTNSQNLNYRFIFVDNHSTDGTIEYLKTIDNSILIVNSENLGFVKAMNQGLQKADSKYVVWLNNDTIVSTNWLSYLIAHLEKYPDVGAIGPITNGTGIIQRDVDWNMEPTLENVSNYAMKFHKKNKNQIYEYHRIAGFCIVMRGEIISKIGLLDEEFNFGGYDDDDYCKRIRNEGYKILIAGDVFIYHKSGATFSRAKDPDLDLAFLMQNGKRRLLRKWIPTNGLSLDEKNQPLVSVIMATKDREKIIPFAIDTVIDQTYKNWELIIINDGGQNLQDLIDKYAEPRIKYINLEENKGKSFANNFAIKNSNGNFIAYLDDDDRWHSHHLQVTMNALTKNDSRMLVYTDYVQVDCTIIDNEKQIPSRKTVIPIKDILPTSLDEINIIPNFCVVHKKSLFEHSGWYDEKLRYYEDWDLLRRFSKQTFFLHVPEITGEYWINQVIGENRNMNAILDKNLEDVRKTIKSKELKNTNPIVLDLITSNKLENKHNYKEALKIYQKIYDTDPEFFLTVRGLATCLFHLENYQEAEKLFTALEKLNPFNLSTHIMKAQCLLRINEYNKAKEELEFGLLLSDDKTCYYLLESCYKNLGNFQTSKFIKQKTSLLVDNVNLKEVSEFLMDLYNKNSFYRNLFTFGYRILKKIYRN